MSQTSRRRSNSVIKLGEHRRNMSSLKKIPSTTYIHGNITNRVDQRIQWAYQNIVNNNTFDLTSKNNRFPNQMLSQYIQYVSTRYNLIDPIKSRQNINNSSSNYYTPKKQHDNQTIAETNRTSLSKSVLQDRDISLQKQSSTQQISLQIINKHQQKHSHLSSLTGNQPPDKDPKLQGRNHIGAYNHPQR